MYGHPDPSFLLNFYCAELCMMKYTCANKNLELILTATDAVAPCLEQTQTVLTH